MQTYSLLRSKTFWTLVIAFILGGVQAISNSLNPDFFLVLNTALLGLASYFHLKTAKAIGAVN